MLRNLGKIIRTGALAGLAALVLNCGSEIQEKKYHQPEVSNFSEGYVDLGWVKPDQCKENSKYDVLDAERSED